MYEAKMKETDKDVVAFIEAIESARRREEAHVLLRLFEDVTGYPGKLWGESIIGFGRYHYVYASGHSGDAPKVGFSPRKAKHSLYLMSYDSNRDAYLARLGKTTSGVSCVYVNKLADIDLAVLREMIAETVRQVDEMYPEDGAAENN